MLRTCADVEFHLCEAIVVGAIHTDFDPESHYAIKCEFIQKLVTVIPWPSSLQLGQLHLYTNDSCMGLSINDSRGDYGMGN